MRALRSDLIDPTIAVHNGRVVKRTGDGALVEFRSVVDAVRCAIEVQNAMIERNAGVPTDRQIEFRIGIYLGDVVEEADGDLMDDGVNIAARLEGIAQPGAICLSEDAYRQVRARLDLEVSDLGQTRLKNIVDPVRVYSLQVGLPAQAKPSAPVATVQAAKEEKPAPPPALPDKPSLAVLPFQNMSGDPEQDYFVDGMVEDIITGLSRIKWLFVIARNSSFVHKGKAVDIRQVGRELGVRYVLEGGVRKAGNRLRITAQLIEAETGAHLWADRFDGAPDDVFELQDQITEQVVGIVEPSLQHSEIERARQKRPENLDAYDLYLRALPYSATRQLTDAKIAADLLESALKLNPRYATAHALLALCYQMIFVQGGHREEDKTAGLKHARAAIAGAGDDATALATAAMVIGHLGWDHPAAIDTIKSALAINPSSATVNYHACHIYYLSGNFAQGRLHADRALRLSPAILLLSRPITPTASPRCTKGAPAKRPRGSAGPRRRMAAASLLPRAGRGLGPGWLRGRRARACQTAFGRPTEPICRNVRSNRIDARSPGQTRRRRAPAGGVGIKFTKHQTMAGGAPVREIIACGR